MRIFRNLLKVFIPVLIIAIIMAYFFVNYSLNKKQFNISEAVEIHIKHKASFSEIIELLRENKLLDNPIICRLYFILTGKHKLVKAGYYLFDKPLSIKELADKLVKGEVIYYRITFPEGSNIFDIERKIREENILYGEDYYKVINSKEILIELREIDENINNIEGYLFPETYYFPKGEKIEELIKMMIKEFKKRNLRALKESSKELDYTIHEIVTMASLIEKESANNSEKPLIASVFYNRLKRRMLLQCDPTVIYSYYLEGKIIGILKKEDLNINSPYNTYQNVGLPPGPICNPGEKSLNAAMHPADSDYFYFVSKGNGSHYFSKELNEHLRAKAKFLR